MEGNSKIKIGKFAKSSMVLSVWFAIHFVVSQFLFLFLPFFNHSADGLDHTFDLILICFAGILGFSALLHSFKGHHQNPFPIKVFSIGFLCMFVSIFLHNPFLHLPLMVIGSIICGFAQFYNLKIAHLNGANH